MRVEAELPSAARRLDTLFARVKGTARLRMEVPYSSDQPPLTKVRFAVDHGMEKVELERLTRDATPVKLADIVYCVGEDTAFQLYRPTGAASYDVRGIGSSSEDRDLYVSLFGRFLIAHRGVQGLTLTDMLDRPGFKVASAETIDREGKRLMRADCEFGSQGSEERVSLVLDPAAGWIVRTSQYRPSYDPGSVFDFEIEYGPSRGEVPLPVRVRLKDPGGVTHHCDFTEWVFAPTPATEFNMTFYGLPDLVNAHKPRNALRYWLFGLAIATGLIAIGLWRYTSRARSTAQA